MRNEPTEHTTPLDWIHAALLCVALNSDQQETIYDTFVEHSYEFLDNIDCALRFLDTTSIPEERNVPLDERAFAIAVRTDIANEWRNATQEVKDLRSTFWVNLRIRVLIFARQKAWRVPISTFYSIGADVQLDWQVISILPPDPTCPMYLRRCHWAQT